MKQVPLLLLFPLLFGACHRAETPVETAAMGLYQRYANNSEGVTVAYIGDFHAYDQVFNAVMFHADDSAQWQWLQQEFGVIDPGEIDPKVEARDGVTMVSLHIDTSLHFGSQEQYQAYVDSLVQQVVRETMGTYDTTDTNLFVGTVYATDSDIAPKLQTQMQQHLQFDQNRKPDGSAEYIISADLENHTLLCFFCNTSEDARLLVRWLFG